MFGFLNTVLEQLLEIRKVQVYMVLTRYLWYYNLDLTIAYTGYAPYSKPLRNRTSSLKKCM